MSRETGFVDVVKEPLHREIFKNDYLRLYRALLKPGEETAFHRHSVDTLYIVLEGGKILTQTMKNGGYCPTILPKGLPLSELFSLISGKIFSRYMTLNKGFYFFMPSGDKPVIHKAETSGGNSGAMDLLGIEFPYSPLNSPVLSRVRGIKGIENDKITVFRFFLSSGEVRAELGYTAERLILVVAGEAEVVSDSSETSLKAGEYYLATGGLEYIRNGSSKEAQVIVVLLKRAVNVSRE